MKVFLISLFILVSSNFAFAGTCLMQPPDIVSFYQSEAIFIGKVLSVKRFYGIKRTEENWNLKYRIVEFEIQQSYKGVTTGNKISVINSFGDMDWEDLKIKKGQQWLIDVWKYNDNLFFGTGCRPWSKLIESSATIAELNEDFSTLQNRVEQDKQALVGRIKNWGNGQGIENLEIKIKGNDRQFSVFTDKEGLFYLPSASPGEYKITINFPRRFLLPYDIVKIPKEYLDDAVNKDTLIYKIDLKPREFLFSQFNIQFY